MADTDQAEFIRALRAVNDGFDLFCQYQASAAREAVQVFYWLMPRQPVSELPPAFNRCEVWRRYVAAELSRAGNTSGASKVLKMSDEDVLDTCARDGTAI